MPRTKGAHAVDQTRASVLAETRTVAALTAALGDENLIFAPVSGSREPAEPSPERRRAYR